jgi:phosphoglycerate dehydrogenase-like enzyme
VKYILCLLLIGLTPVPITYAAELPASLQGLGLRESATASRDLPGWKRPDKIVVRSLFGQDVIGPLQDVAPGVELVSVATVAEATQEISNAQALIGFCQQEIFSAADSLHWVQVYFAGVENCVSLPGIQGGQLLLSNGQRLSSPTIGDHAIALTYALVRGLDTYHSEQVQGKWAPQAVTSTQNFRELSGRTMLVVGLGGIGTQVAQRAHALGMRILATRGSRREGPDYVEYVGLANEAIKLAPQADVVVNAAPLTDSTRGMFNKAFFEAMKPSAYFVSVGRGQSTVTTDLISALQHNQIAGAGLDVTDPEPLPPDHPLWTTPRVIITPHVAMRSAETYARIWALVVENVRRYIEGEPLLSVVDVKRGY